MTDATSDFSQLLAVLDISHQYCQERKNLYLTYKQFYEHVRQTSSDEDKIEPALLLYMLSGYQYLSDKFERFWFDKEEHEQIFRLHRPDWDYFSPLDFEMLVQTLLYLVEENYYRLTQTSHDKGIDLYYEQLLYSGLEHFGTAKTVVQCKLYRGNVPTPEFRDFFGVMAATIAEGYFFTTGHLTKTAIKFIDDANQSPLANRFHFIGKDKLQKLMELCNSIVTAWHEAQILAAEAKKYQQEIGAIWERIDAIRSETKALIKSPIFTNQQLRLL